jgi:hypothetical protein
VRETAVAEQDFIDRIISGFEMLRERPHLDFLAQQFEAGDVLFLVDNRGIRIESRDELLESPGSAAE